MSNLREDVGGGGGCNKIKIYCQVTQCRKCVLTVPQIVRLGMTKDVNQAKSLKHSEKKSCISYQFRDVKPASTGLDTQPTTTQQRMMCALKNARLLPDGCCCLSDKGNENFFSISISPPLTTIAGLQRMGQWFGLLGYRISHQWTSCYGATLQPWFTNRQWLSFGF